jgi:tRNA-dihydrouridine synthase 3
METLNFVGEAVLAPISRGGNLPYRRLCVEMGARITFSEMVYAREIVRGSPSEFARLRKHPTETCFGVQIATNSYSEAVEAGLKAAERGAHFVDLNAGCPIEDVVRKGLGARLMTKPAKLLAIVEALVKALPVPVTVKIRLGWDSDSIIAPELAQKLEEAGVAAITLHPRTRDQHYSLAADWTMVGRLVAERTIPILGNGDILTHYEAADRWNSSHCAAVMIGRAAMIKPWIFREIKEKKEWLPTTEERIAVYHRLACLMKEHFGDDARGRKRAMFFLPWHFNLFHRYRPFPEAEYLERSRQYPLIQTRQAVETGLSILEQLLRDPRETVHQAMADALWDSPAAADAVERFQAVAAANPPPTAELPPEKPIEG